jgi:hypothetical protein
VQSAPLLQALNWYDVVLFDELVLAPRVSVGFCDELKLVALPFLNHW